MQKYSSDYFNVFSFPIYQCVFSFTTISIGSVLLLPFMSEYKKGNGVIYKVFTYISLISYSMYLLNFSFIQTYAISFVKRYISSMPFILFISYLAITIIGSILLYKYFEKPLMNLREKKLSKKEAILSMPENILHED